MPTQSLRGSDAAGDRARWCGRCGARLEPSEPGSGGSGAGPPREGTSRVPSRPQGRRRRLAALGVVAALAVLLVVLAVRPPAERVTADGLGTDSGRSSTVAATDLSRELWRVATTLPPADPEWPFVGAVAVSEELLLAGSGGRLQVIDRASGDVLGSLPPIVGTPVVRDGRLVVVDLDRLLRIDPRDGRVLDSRQLDRVVTRDSRFPIALPDGGWVVASGEGVVRLSPGGAIVWTAPAPPRGSPFAVNVTEGRTIVQTGGTLSVLDVSDGHHRWTADLGSGDVLPLAGESLTADGRLFTMTKAADDGPPVPVAFDLDSGERLWTAAEPSPMPLLGVHDGVLYRLSGASQRDSTTVRRYDATDGTLLDDLHLPTATYTVRMGPDGVVLVADTPSSAVVFDADTGRELWRRDDLRVGTQVDDAVVATTRAAILLLEPRTGNVLLEVPHPTPGDREDPGPPAIAGRSVLIAPGHAVDLADGSDTFREVGADPWGSPLTAIGDGFMVRDTVGDHVVDEHGTPRWRLDSSGDGPRPEANLDGRVLVSSSELGGTSQLLDAADGQPIGPRLAEELSDVTRAGDLLVGRASRRDRQNPQVSAYRVAGDRLEPVWDGRSFGGRLLADSDHVYEVSDAVVVVRSAEDGKITASWTLPFLPDEFAAADATLIITAADGRAAGIDVATGQPRWSTTLPSPVTSPPTIAGDVAYFGTADGQVHLYELDGQPRGSVHAADDPIRRTVVAHGVLVARTDDQAVAYGPPGGPNGLPAISRGPSEGN